MAICIDLNDNYGKTGFGNGIRDKRLSKRKKGVVSPKKDMKIVISFLGETTPFYVWTVLVPDREGTGNIPTCQTIENGTESRVSKRKKGGRFPRNRYEVKSYLLRGKRPPFCVWMLSKL